MHHNVLTFRAVLCVSMCVEVVLADIQSSNRGCLVRGHNFVNRFVFDGFVGARCVVFPCRGKHLFDPVDGPFGWIRDLSDGSRVVDGRCHVVVYDVLSSSPIDAQVRTRAPSEEIRSDALFFGTGFVPAGLSEWD